MQNLFCTDSNQYGKRWILWNEGKTFDPNTIINVSEKNQIYTTCIYHVYILMGIHRSKVIVGTGEFLISGGQLAWILLHGITGVSCSHSPQSIIYTMLPAPKAASWINLVTFKLHDFTRDAFQRLSPVICGCLMLPDNLLPFNLHPSIFLQDFYSYHAKIYMFLFLPHSIQIHFMEEDTRMVPFATWNQTIYTPPNFSPLKMKIQSNWEFEESCFEWAVIFLYCLMVLMVSSHLFKWG